MCLVGERLLAATAPASASETSISLPKAEKTRRPEMVVTATAIATFTAGHTHFIPDLMAQHHAAAAQQERGARCVVRVSRK